MKNNVTSSIYALNNLPKTVAKLFSSVTGEELLTLSAEEIRDRAEKYLDTPIPFLTLSMYRSYARHRESESFERGYAMRRNMLLTLILAEAATGSGKYIDRICDLVWAVSEETSWVLPRNTGVSPTAPDTDVPEVCGSDALHGIDIYALATAAIFATVYKVHLETSLCSVSDILTERTEFEVYNRCIIPLLNIGLAPTVRSPEVYEALAYIAASGIVPEDTAAAVTRKLRFLGA